MKEKIFPSLAISVLCFMLASSANLYGNSGLLSATPGYLYGNSVCGTDWFCELNRWNAYNNGLDSYLSTWSIWRNQGPDQCLSNCQSQCSTITDPIQRQTCINNCPANCESIRRFNYDQAWNALFAASNIPCNHNPDYCSEARARRDQCNLNHQTRWENPVYNEKTGDYDEEWLNHTFEEYSSCFQASGIHNCE